MSRKTLPTVLFALLSAPASAAISPQPPEPCDFAATVKGDGWTWGAPVAIQWGGWWAAPPAPHSPIVAVEASTIHFVLDASSFGGPQVEVPWCEAASTPPLPPGDYQIVTTVLSWGFPMLSKPQGSVSIPPGGECDFAATVERVEGGGAVTIRMGGISASDCTPGTPTLTVKDGVIELSLCLVEFGCGWSITPWCEMATSEPLPPGTYEVVTTIRKPGVQFPPGPCDTVLETIHRGAIEIPGARDPGPFGEDFNAGHAHAWSTRHGANGCIEAAVVEGTLRLTEADSTCLADALRLDASVTDPGAFRDGNIRARVTITEIAPFSLERVAFILRGAPEGFFAMNGYRFMLSSGGGVSIWRGRFDELAFAPFTVEAGRAYWMEASAVGDHLELRVWNETGERPAAPTLAVVDGSLADGFVGVVAMGLWASSAIIDDLSFTPTGSELLDDFTTDLAAWTVDATSTIPVDVGTEEGRAVISTTKAASGEDRASLLFMPSVVEPTPYADGVLRVSLVAGSSEASLVARSTASGGYAARFRGTDGAFRIVRWEEGTETTLHATTTALRGGDPLVMELSTVGDRISATLRRGEGLDLPESSLEANDDTHRLGAIGVEARGSPDLRDPTPLRVEFADIWFTAARPDTGDGADLDGDGFVGPGDLAILLGAWGTKGPGDLDADGTVGPADLALLIGAWS